jgi:predicted nicotinamide N-methyase
MFSRFLLLLLSWILTLRCSGLHLSAYLASSTCTLNITGKHVLELGAGTGYLSIFCAKYLNAGHVTATDGSDDVIADLGTNFYLNGLQDSTLIEAKELKWGQVLLGGEEPAWNRGRMVDAVLMADVFYDITAQPALLATIVDLVQLYPSVEILMCHTMRNEATWQNFVKICGMNGFVLEEINFPVQKPADQEGPFYWEGISLKLCFLRTEGK